MENLLPLNVKVVILGIRLLEMVEKKSGIREAIKSFISGQYSWYPCQLRECDNCKSFGSWIIFGIRYDDNYQLHIKNKVLCNECFAKNYKKFVNGGKK